MTEEFLIAHLVTDWLGLFGILYTADSLSLKVLFHFSGFEVELFPFNIAMFVLPMVGQLIHIPHFNLPRQFSPRIPIEIINIASTNVTLFKIRGNFETIINFLWI